MLLSMRNIKIAKYNSFLRVVVNKLVFFCILTVISCCLTVHAAENTELSSSQLKKIAREAKLAESRFSNLTIKSEGQIWIKEKTSLNDPCSNWLDTPLHTHCTLWLDTDKDRRKVEVDTQVLEWLDGSEPYIQSKWSASFNGSEGRYVRHDSGALDNPKLQKTGFRTPNRPPRLNGGDIRTATGLAFTSHYFFENKGYTFSDLFDWADEPNTMVPSSFKFEWDNFSDRKCIKISAKGVDTFRKNYWLDPNRGFALLGFEDVAILEDGRERLIRSINVNKLKQIAEGVWWPVRATVILRLPWKEEEIYRKKVYEAIDVTAGKDLKNKDFTIKFPDGYKVEDKIEKKTYIVEKGSTKN